MWPKMCPSLRDLQQRKSYRVSISQQVCSSHSRLKLSVFALKHRAHPQYGPRFLPYSFPAEENLSALLFPQPFHKHSRIKKTLFAQQFLLLTEAKLIPQISNNSSNHYDLRLQCWGTLDSDWSDGILEKQEMFARKTFSQKLESLYSLYSCIFFTGGTGESLGWNISRICGNMTLILREKKPERLEKERQQLKCKREQELNCFTDVP